MQPLAEPPFDRDDRFRYDAELPERYSMTLVFGAVPIVFALVAADLAFGLSFADIVATILVPSAPVLSRTAGDAFRQRDAADAQKSAFKEAEPLWELAVAGRCDPHECARRSREFQNSMLQRRTSNPLMLPWIYGWLRPGMESDMNVGALKLLEQAGIPTSIVPSWRLLALRWCR